MEFDRLRTSLTSMLLAGSITRRIQDSDRVTRTTYGVPCITRGRFRTGDAACQWPPNSSIFFSSSFKVPSYFFSLSPFLWWRWNEVSHPWPENRNFFLPYQSEPKWSPWMMQDRNSCPTRSYLISPRWLYFFDRWEWLAFFSIRFHLFVSKGRHSHDRPLGQRFLTSESEVCKLD